VLGAAGKIGEPSLHRPAGAAARSAVESGRGEERRPLPCALGQALDYPLAQGVERDDLDRAWLGIRIVDAEPRLLGRGHARAFTGHFAPPQTMLQETRSR